MIIKFLLDRIIQLFTQIETSVRISNKADLFDVNIIAEDIMRPVLAEAYGLCGLVNLNLTKKGAAAVDLGDREAGVAVQVTSRTDNEKVKEMLRAVVRHERYLEFPTIRLLALTTFAPYKDAVWKNREAGWKEITEGKFAFDRSHIITLGDLVRLIRGDPAKIQKILQTLEETVGNGSFFSFEALRKACLEITEGTIKTKLRKRVTVERDELKRNVDLFIASDMRYAFVTGRSAVGKSTALAKEAVRLRDEGYTVLFVPVLPGTSFTLEDVANQVRQRLSVLPPRLEWSRVMRPWEAAEVATKPAEQLIVIVDGLEAGDRDHVAVQLAYLDRSLALHSASVVKVLLSCRDAQLDGVLREEALQAVPSFQHRGLDHAISPLEYGRFEIDDFSNGELDRALQAIGAVDLLRENDARGRLDSHVASMRALLKHPGTFEHYANLFVRGEIDEARSETWSSLLRRRIDHCLSEAERFCDVSSEQIRPMLVRTARHCWETKTVEFVLSGDTLKEVSPDLFVPDAKGRDVYSALMRVGVLQGTSMIEFAITDAGPFLLSFELEEQFATTSVDERKALVSTWLKERWTYWPLLDAVLALVDRLSDEPDTHRKNLLAIVETLVADHHDNDLFRLLRPSILKSIFKLVKQGDEDRLLYTYREPALHVRYSEENIPLIKSNLKDVSEHARELAAILVGHYKLEHLVPGLIKGLEDENENVREACYKSISRIGEPALAPLIAALSESSDDLPRATRIVWAIIGVGFHSEELSRTVDELFTSLPDTDGTDLNRFKESLLLLSGAKRDKLQAAHAAVALHSPDERVSNAAAKYFAEAPSREVFDDLVALLKKTDINAAGAWRGEWFASQLITAILSVDRERGEPIVTAFLNDLFVTDDISHKRWVTEVAEKRSLTGCYPIIYENLVRRFNTPDSKVEYVWYRIAEQLIETWTPEALAAIRLAARILRGDGIDAAKVFVDAVYPHVGSESYRYADRLNRVTDLRLAIASGSERFGQEAIRLFDVTSRFGTRDLADFFWILADTTFETQLLAALDKEIEKNHKLPQKEQRLTASYIARALGTCGTRRSAERVLSFICDSPTVVHLEFPAEVLVCLLSRGLLAADELATVAKTTSNHRMGRALCIEALATYDAASHLELFREIAETPSENPLLRAAIDALGLTGSREAVPPLRRILRRTDVSEGDRSHTAHALAMIGDWDSLSDIEEAFLDLEEYEGPVLFRFIGAMRHFCGATADRVLRSVETETTSEQVKLRLREARIAFPIDPGDDASRARMLEVATEQSPGFRDPQKEVVHMMLDACNSEALGTIVEYLEKGLLTAGSRFEIIRHLRKLAGNPEVKREMVIRLMLPLLDDNEPHVRYSFLSLLQFLDRGVCAELYHRSSGEANNEWKRACAVESIGFWESDPSEISARRWDLQHLVRRSADLASKQLEKGRSLHNHIEQFRIATGLERLVSYLSLKHNGDRGTIRRLVELRGELGESTTESIQISQLVDQIRQELERRERDLDKEQQKRLDERVRISFD